MKYKIIEGPNVSLCATLEEYFPSFLGWVNDLESALLIGRMPPFSPSDEAAWLSRYRPPSQDKAFTVFKHDDDKPHGIVSLDSVDTANRHAYLGMIIDSQMRGQGIGEEAFRLAAEYAFYVMNLHSLRGQAYSFNTTMLHMAEKLGFQDVGRFRESRLVNGRYYDTFIQDLLEQDFRRIARPRIIRDIIHKNARRSRCMRK
jgi:RimJ/RimL family protein N-acetyltransferase